jgi:hypothetical protein
MENNFKLKNVVFWDVTQEPHGVTFQKTAFVRVAAVKT